MDEWKPMLIRAICRRCTSPCCADPRITVVLDYEKKKRTLTKYKYRYVDVNTVNQPILKKDQLGACVYFDKKTRRCSIYQRRPWSCRAWFCGRGTKHNEVWLNLKGGPRE